MIRKMTVDDISHIQHIVHENWGQQLLHLLPEASRLNYLNKCYSDIMLNMRYEKTNFLLYIIDCKVVGFINFTNVDEDGDTELLAIHVLKNYENQSIGKELFNAMITHIQNRAKQVSTYVDWQNSYAQQYYEKLNFQSIQIFDEIREGFTTKTIEYSLHIAD